MKLHVTQHLWRRKYEFSDWKCIVSYGKYGYDNPDAYLYRNRVAVLPMDQLRLIMV